MTLYALYGFKKNISKKLPLWFYELQISFQALVLRAFHSTVLKHLAEYFFRDLIPLFQRIIKQARLVDELRLVMRNAKAVPWTNILAHIATEHPTLEARLWAT